MFQFNFDVGGNVDGPAVEETNVTDSTNIEVQNLSTSCTVAHTRVGERYHWNTVYVSASPTKFNEVTMTRLQSGQSPHHDEDALAFYITDTNDPSFLTKIGAIRSILTSSDLQTGVYEGGFKLWECSIDLVRYLDHLVKDSSYQMPPKVMELGCGHGLPGIYALQMGASQVAFLDYNKEVLELTTCPNVARNTTSQPSLYDKAVFYAGAWESVSCYMSGVEGLSVEQVQYDLILTAETIYTEAVAIELYQMIKRHLRRSVDAMALVAAKKYYFGTNGSVQHFFSLLNREGILKGQIVWEEVDQRSNIRDIIKVTHQY